MVEEVMDGVTTSYLYGDSIDEALQMIQGSNIYYYHSNHIGSVVALSDSNGTIIEQVTYDAYGEPHFFDANGNSITQSLIGNVILFTGREYENESMTYYFRARTMHPRVGRFMQKDPLTYVNGMNDFSYALNFPVILTDPSGEILPLLLVIAAGAGAFMSGWEIGKSLNNLIYGNDCMTTKEKWIDLGKSLAWGSLSFLPVGAGKLAFGSSAGRAFWSGLGKNGAEKAAEIAAKNGMRTLEQTPLGSWLSKNVPWKEGLNKYIWDETSQFYALTSGKNSGAILGNPGAQSTWRRIEEPVLKFMRNYPSESRIIKVK